MPARPIVVGRTFERLFAFAEAGFYTFPSGKRMRQTWVRCSCGSPPFVVHNTSLTSGNTRSCGCLKIEQQTKHGHAKKHGQMTRTYNIWKGIAQRCDNPNYHAFDQYGGNGRLMCEHWRSDYRNFLADMGECPPGLTIERIDNKRGYEPGNCIWATRAVQARNTTRTRNFTVCGVTGCLQDLAAHFGIHKETVRCRLKLGWTPEQAFTLPLLHPSYGPPPQQPPPSPQSP